MGIVNNTLAGASGGGVSGLKSQRSLRLRRSASAYLNRTPAVAGNRKTWTYSAVIKLGAIGRTNGLLSATTGTPISFGVGYNDAGDASIFITVSGVGVGATTAQFRDPAAWYHIIIRFDTTQATAANRVLIYVNGINCPLNNTLVSQNTNYEINNNTQHLIGVSAVTGSNSFFDGYLSEINFIDGQSLPPSSFGEFSPDTGVWIPKKYTGPYGTNGFYLDFKTTTSPNTLCYDKSGNGNNWTPNNISTVPGITYDSVTDVPMQTSASSANYAVLNPLNKGTVTGATWTQGNLTFSPTTTNNWGTTTGTLEMRSGKWYWECTATSATESMFGITSSATVPLNATPAGWDSVSWAYYSSGEKYTNAAPAWYGASFSSGDIIGVAFDADLGTLAFYKNGLSQGTAFTGIPSGAYVAHIGTTTIASASASVSINFGQQPFVYTPPALYTALNTYNMPVPTVKVPKKYANSLAWAGVDSTGNRSFTGLGFSPEVVWAKRCDNSSNHLIYDILTGPGPNNELCSNSAGGIGSTNAESYDYLSSFDADGFSSTFSGIAGNSTYYFNSLGGSYVAWCWKRSTLAGIAILNFTGTGAVQSISHGLGVAPAFILTHAKDALANWNMYHRSLGNNSTIYLENTSGETSNANLWNNTDPSSTAITVGSSFTNGLHYTAYVFAEVPGFSKFGKYTGIGLADGNFVHCGFLPRYILIRGTASPRDWLVYDTARSTFNGLTSTNGGPLQANTTGTAYTTGYLGFDIVSNGFKIRETSASLNTAASVYTYAAFADNPLKYANAR